MRLFKIKSWQAAALGLLVASVPALAFQESKVSGDKPEQAPLTAPQLTLPEQKPGVSLSSPEVAGRDSKGTEIRLPGMGKLGVLPKLDFGLDVLYGANEDRKALPNQKEEELTVRGSIKHKF